MSKIKSELSEIRKEESSLTKPIMLQRGFENRFDKSDLILPHAKLMQAMSPELAENLPELKVGSTINSLTKKVLSGEFIPVFVYKTWARFNSRNPDDSNYDSDFEPGETIWKSSDPLDPRVQEQAQFGSDGQKPLATTFMNFFSHFPESPMPIIISFSKSSYKTGKQLLSLAKFSGADMFSKKYKLMSAMETNSSGTFAVLKVTPVGDSSPEEFKFCEKLWNDFSGKAKEIKIAEEYPSDELPEKEL